MKRPPSCGCGCSCRSIWTPGDNVQREQWLYDAALVLDNNPIQEVLTAPFAIQFDGLPGGPAALPGGVRAFGPTPAGQDPTGWGYFNVNPESVRFQTLCDWPDMTLDSIDPLFAIKRADHPYPDPDLHDNPRRGHVPFTFGATTKVCQWSTSFEHVVHTSDYLVGEIPDAIQNITITFDDMYFRPTNWYVDRVQLYKFYFPFGRTAGGVYVMPPTASVPLNGYAVGIYAVYYNAAMGIGAVPIVSVPKSECVFPAVAPLHANTIVPPGTWTPATTGYLDAARAKSDVLKRDNLLPGWKIVAPEISGNPHVGRTVEDSIDIYSYITFDSGHWTVTPTIDRLKCDAQLCHYYSIPVTQNAVLVAAPNDANIGNEAILPLVTGPNTGHVFYSDGTPRNQMHGQDDWKDFAISFNNSDPLKGVFAVIRQAVKVHSAFYPGFLDPIGTNIGLVADKNDPATITISHMQNIAGGGPALALSPAYMQAFLASFSNGDVFEIDRIPMTQIPDQILDTDLVGGTPYFPQFSLGVGKYLLPAFLGEQDVLYTFEPHSERLLDTSRDITTLSAYVPNDQIDADGYEHTMTDAEKDLYRQAADPVTIPLEAKEITHAVTTRVAPTTAVADGMAVCFHSSWGGTPPNYDYPPNSGPVKTETHSVPGATIVRETI